MKIMYFNCNAGSNYTGKYKVPNYILKTINSEEDVPHIIILTEVVPFFEDNEEYREFVSKYFISFSRFEQTKKNSVIIAVRKDIEIRCVNDIMCAFDKDEYAPDYLNIQIDKDGKSYNVIGFRMLTDKYDYDWERKLFDKFINNNELQIKDTVTVLVGDFNNAKHYGDINKSFSEVEHLYWKADWDNEKRRYSETKRKVPQYNYNLHIIKDLFLEKGLGLVEKEDDYSFLYKNNPIHDDHFFISSEESDRVIISFYDSEQPLDHRYFVAEINED